MPETIGKVMLFLMCLGVDAKYSGKGNDVLDCFRF